ncbi:hypothetical protein ACA910_016803 [Epithemia clementina (nom. ined.)]
MRLSAPRLSAFLGLLVLSTENGITIAAKKHSKPISGSRTPRRQEASPGPRGSRPRVSPRRKSGYEDDEDEGAGFDNTGFDDGPDSLELEAEEEIVEEEEELEEDEYVPSRKPARSATQGPPSASKLSRDSTLRSSNKAPTSRRPPKSRPPPRFEDDDEDEYRPKSRRQPPPRPDRSTGQGQRRPDGRSSRPPTRQVNPNDRRAGSVVPYTRHQQPSVFARSLDVIRNSVPDPSTIREVASTSLNAARATTSSLSANIYREIKGLTSSELEQVLLKATRPDDSPVKGKHVERLVGVTYQISPRFDIYDAVLRKLWAKMAEKDWRTKVKALYVLHRFSADGAPEHAAALKAHLRELRRTRDPKRKDKYFNSKQLLAGESKPETVQFRAFMSRYAHYVILRAQCFSGMFDEIASEPKVDKKKPPKPITNTALRSEHLEAAAMLFKAGLACQLKDGEECENTAIAAERVASDLIGLTAAVAMALNRVLKEDDLKRGDPVLIKKWCELYRKQLLPQTKAMVKKISPKLDAYGLFLPSRMGTSVSPELLERGLNLLEVLEEDEDEESGEDAKDEGTIDDENAANKKKPQDVKKAPEDKDEAINEEVEVPPSQSRGKRPPARQQEEDEEEDEAAIEEEEGEVDEDEYDYEEEEYYDDEEE